MFESLSNDAQCKGETLHAFSRGLEGGKISHSGEYTALYHWTAFNFQSSFY